MVAKIITMESKHKPRAGDIIIAPVYSQDMNLWYCLITNTRGDVIRQKIFGETDQTALSNAKLLLAANDLLEAGLKIKSEIDTDGLLQGSYDNLLVAIKDATE